MSVSVEVRVPKEKVTTARTLLDRFAIEPPWVCTHEQFPGVVLLKYDKPEGDGFVLFHHANTNGWKAKRIPS